MLRIVVMVGTRKGCFLLESDEARRDWELRGPFCEGWPIYHADLRRRDAARSTPPPRASGTARRSGARATSARRGSTRARASPTARTALKLSKISGLAAAHGRLLAGAEAAGIFESRDGGVTWSLLSDARRPAGARGLERCRRTSRRATSACRRSAAAPRRRVAASGRSSRASGSSRRPTTARRGRRATAGLRADWPRDDAEVGFCVHKLVMSPADRAAPLPAEPLRHAPQRRRRPLVDGDHRGPADRLRLRRRRAPARPRHVLRDPARPGPRALHARRPRRPSGARATPARAGSG